jgi:hypothetical protein
VSKQLPQPDSYKATRKYKVEWIKNLILQLGDNIHACHQQANNTFDNNRQNPAYTGLFLTLHVVQTWEEHTSHIFVRTP